LLLTITHSRGVNCTSSDQQVSPVTLVISDVHSTSLNFKLRE
jgi:hypothetical protein